MTAGPAQEQTAGRLPGPGDVERLRVHEYAQGGPGWCAACKRPYAEHVMANRAAAAEARADALQRAVDAVRDQCTTADANGMILFGGGRARGMLGTEQVLAALAAADAPQPEGTT